MRASKRQQLVRELDVVKRRLRRHGFEVAYDPLRARSLLQHIADIKLRDELERLLTEGS